MNFISRFFPHPSKSFFLLGPRGTGKTTLIKSRYKEALWIDFLRPDVFRSYLAYPERLFETLEGHRGVPVVVIDEIQKVPELLSVIHSVIEEKKGLQFILTGSSARKLKRSGTNLLGGRALNYTLNPFMAAELGASFSFSNALRYGMLPLLLGEKDPQAILHAYVSLYLQEEVHMEGLTRNIESFARFLEVVSFSHGSLINVSNIARESEIKRKTVENYLQILEDLLLAYQLPVFSKRAQRELIAHSKFYLFDTGVFRTLRPQGILDKVEEIEGAALEGLVAQHLKAWKDYSQDPHTLSFWRTRSGIEVDFVVYGPQGFWAIEVKNKKKIFPQDIKPLEAFLEDYPMAKALMLYRGTEYLQLKNVLCIPCGDFLSQLKPNQKIWM